MKKMFSRGKIEFMGFRLELSGKILTCRDIDTNYVAPPRTLVGAAKHPHTNHIETRYSNTAGPSGLAPLGAGRPMYFCSYVTSVTAFLPVQLYYLVLTEVTGE